MRVLSLDERGFPRFETYEDVLRRERGEEYDEPSIWEREAAKLLQSLVFQNDVGGKTQYSAFFDYPSMSEDPNLNYATFRSTRFDYPETDHQQQVFDSELVLRLDSRGSFQKDSSGKPDEHRYDTQAIETYLSVDLHPKAQNSSLDDTYQAAYQELYVRLNPNPYPPDTNDMHPLISICLFSSGGGLRAFVDSDKSQVNHLVLDLKDPLLTDISNHALQMILESQSKHNPFRDDIQITEVLPNPKPKTRVIKNRLIPLFRTQNSDALKQFVLQQIEALNTEKLEKKKEALHTKLGLLRLEIDEVLQELRELIRSNVDPVVLDDEEKAKLDTLIRELS